MCKHVRPVKFTGITKSHRQILLAESPTFFALSVPVVPTQSDAGRRQNDVHIIVTHKNVTNAYRYASVELCVCLYIHAHEC